ncbi:DUF2235 domain-containing protein [Salix suchowensis]|nr:DUF2235 domain-containing protein [Salix suchowensis]
MSETDGRRDTAEPAMILDVDQTAGGTDVGEPVVLPASPTEQPPVDGMPYLSPSPERALFTRPLPVHEPTSILARVQQRYRRFTIIGRSCTGDQFDADNSNIVQLFSLLKKDDKTKQMVYYQVSWLKIFAAGIYLIYMYSKVGYWDVCLAEGATPVMSKVSQTHVDLMTDTDGYEFLMQNRKFDVGRARPYVTKSRSEQIWMGTAFVFLVSPGEHTPLAHWRNQRRRARAYPAERQYSELQGNLQISRKSGLLYVYVRFPPLNSNLIFFVGLPLRYAPFSRKPQSITHLHLFIDVGGGSVSNKTRHSLARISLRWMIRECFKTNTGIMFDAERLKNVGLDPQTLHPFVTPRPPSRSPGSSKIMKRPKEEKRWRFPWSKKPPAAPSTAPSEKDGLLSRPPSPFPPIASVSEEEEELLDALSPKYDQLKLKPFWWILEFIPMEYRFQVGKITAGPNKARSRIIPRQRSSGFKVHRSVKIRMEAEHEHHNPKKQKKYTPKAKFHTDPIWVD